MHVSDVAVGISSCPEQLGYTLQVLTETTVQHVPWRQLIGGHVFKLHDKTLSILPLMTLNETILKTLEKTYQQLDSTFYREIDDVRRSISGIHDTSETGATTIVSYPSLGFSIAKAIALVALAGRFFCKFTHPEKGLCKHCHLLQAPNQPKHEHRQDHEEHTLNCTES